MARVLLIQPPLSSGELFARSSMASASILPPLGLAYVAAYLRERGHECRIVDGLAEPISLPALCDIARPYDVVGITVLSTYAVRVIELIRALKVGRVPAPVVVGGPHVTAMPESLLDQGADYAVVGEGEATMCELVESLAAGRKPRDVKGLVFRDGDKYLATERRPRLDPLDQAPMPARDLLPMAGYRSSVARSSRQPSHSMLTSRGCPGTCSFCSKMTFGTKTRYFSVDRIVEEFFLLRDKYGARDVSVWDDNFVSNPDVIFAACEQLRRRDFHTTWSVEARVDGVSREILAALKGAGCDYIAYGIESGSQRILDYVNKRVRKEQIRETIAITKEVGIPIRGYFMMGMPTETPQEMEETIRFAMELDVDVASFTLFVPLPGTVEYKRAQRSGQFDPEYYLHRIVPEINFLDEPLYVPEGMTAAQLLTIHRKAYNRYYFRPRTLLRKLLSLRSAEDIAAAWQGGMTLVGNLLSGK